MSQLRVVQRNVNGLRSRLVEFRATVAKCEADIILLQDWAHGGAHGWELSLPGFRVFGDKSGSAAVAVREKIACRCRTVSETEGDESLVAVEVLLFGERSVFVASYYKRPRPGQSAFPMLKCELLALQQAGHNVIIGGDFNAVDPLWDDSLLDPDPDLPVYSNGCYERGRALVDVITELQLGIGNDGQATRGRRALDLTLTLGPHADVVD